MTVITCSMMVHLRLAITNRPRAACKDIADVYLSCETCQRHVRNVFAVVHSIVELIWGRQSTLHYQLQPSY